MRTIGAMSIVSEAGHDLKVSGNVLITAGVLTLIIGIVAIVWPDITLLVLAILAGINLFILGVIGIVQGVTGEPGTRALAIILGVLALIAGLVLLKRPGETLTAFILVLGIWFVISAVVSFVRAIFEPGDRGIRFLVAFVEFVFGVLILALPDLSLKTLAVLTGIAFGIRGVDLILAGNQLRRAGKAGEAAGTPTPAAA
jgi:uncharacterized membrane protein HdeD (DUF308 family)